MPIVCVISILDIHERHVLDSTILGTQGADDLGAAGEHQHLRAGHLDAEGADARARD